MVTAAITLLAACPYCMGTVESGRSAYLAATAIMLVVPIVMVAVAWLWLRGALRRR